MSKQKWPATKTLVTPKLDTGWCDVQKQGEFNGEEQGFKVDAFFPDDDAFQAWVKNFTKDFEEIKREAIDKCDTAKQKKAIEALTVEDIGEAETDKETGEETGRIRVRFKNKYFKPAVVDAGKQPFDGDVKTGGQVRTSFSLRIWWNPTKVGVQCFLLGVQVFDAGGSGSRAESVAVFEDETGELEEVI